MASKPGADQLIVIVGPTASGKSDAGMRVALKHNGEIICADSRTVYKGLDIGTAKPGVEEQASIPHHLLDIVEPGETFSAARFQLLANQAIDDIKARDKLPVMVGGTGLFIDGVLFDYEFGAPADATLRNTLEAMTVAALQKYCNQHNIELPNNVHNKRHLIRVIEQNGVNHKRKEGIRRDAYVVGIAPEKEMLQEHIQKRAEQMFEGSVINEATFAAKKYGWDAPGLTGNIYPIIHQLTDGVISKSEAITIFARADWQLARRQMTWFRRNKFIYWCGSADEAEQLIKAHLSKS